jgi:hypothetical protein
VHLAHLDELAEKIYSTCAQAQEEHATIAATPSSRIFLASTRRRKVGEGFETRHTGIVKKDRELLQQKFLTLAFSFRDES